MNYADKDPPTKRSWPNFPPPSHVLDFIKQGYEQTRPVTTLLKLKFRAFIFVQDVKFMKIKGSKDSKEGTKIPLHRASSALKTKKTVSDSHYNHRLAHNVPAQTMDPGLDQNQPELGILVLPVPLQVLADGHGLLDEEVHVLG